MLEWCHARRRAIGWTFPRQLSALEKHPLHKRKTNKRTSQNIWRRKRAKINESAAGIHPQYSKEYRPHRQCYEEVDDTSVHCLTAGTALSCLWQTLLLSASVALSPSSTESPQTKEIKQLAKTIKRAFSDILILYKKMSAQSSNVLPYFSKYRKHKKPETRHSFNDKYIRNFSGIETVNANTYSLWTCTFFRYAQGRCTSAEGRFN